MTATCELIYMNPATPADQLRRVVAAVLRTGDIDLAWDVSLLLRSLADRLRTADQHDLGRDLLDAADSLAP